MTRDASSPILQLIRRTVADQRVRDISDHELLQRFSDQRDEAAFHTLLCRHGPMVLEVCRSALANEADAEDAFQATFIILARKAASIRKKASVGSWLHGVAYRTALKARQQSATRRKNEACAPARQISEPDDLTWREVRQVVHAELTGLPERYRVPLVLCYLEGKTQDKVAVQLGLANSTLKERLERGRALLRARLVRRGLGPAGVLVAAWPSTTASACLPLTLVSSTIKAAGLSAAGLAIKGVISAKTAALTEGVMKTMLLTKLKTASAVLIVAVVIAAGAVGLGFPVPTAEAQPLRTPRPDNQETPPGAKAADAPIKPFPAEKPVAETKVSVRGRVFTPDGKAVAGAKLYLGYTGPDDMKYPVRATSGDDGRFNFNVEQYELDSIDSENPTLQVIAVAQGHGCDWTAVGPAAEELTLRLIKDVPISVRILDPDGKPVGGAKLTVLGVSAPKDDLGSYIDAVRKGEGYAFPKNWKGPLPGQPTVLTTGADGRLLLTGAGRERVVHLRIDGPSIASGSLTVMTRDTESVKNAKRGMVHGASSDYVGIASRPIQGVVRDKETGKPIAGVSVGVPGGWVNAVTDKEGRYELLGRAKSEQYTLLAKPSDGLYFQRQLREVQDIPGFAALNCDIELVRGLTVRGKVTDKATGKPIAAVRVDYHPLGGNTYVDKLLSGSWNPRAEATTGADGSYAITVLPGPGVIGIIAPKWGAYMPAAVPLKERKDFFKARLVDDTNEEDFVWYAGGGSSGGISVNSYNAVMLLEPGEKVEVPVRDVTLERPLERKGRVVGPDGQKFTGVRVCGLVRRGVETLDGDEFTVRGLNPKANRPVVFYHKEKNLGFFVKDLRDVADGPLVVKLQPCGSVSGRVVDRDGQPVAGLRLDIWGHALNILRGEEGGGWQRVTTDKDGRFQVEGLVSGQEYMIWEPSSRPSYPRIYALMVTESGKHKDIGDIKMGE